MPLCDEKKFIYVHVPKCAGTSLAHAFRSTGIQLKMIGRMAPEEQAQYGIADTLWWQHLSAVSLQRIIPLEQWRTYFKFTFVRNPWDRMVSHYFYHERRTIQSKWFQKTYPEIVERHRRLKCFDEWVRGTINEVEPQVYYILGHDQKPCLDFIGKCENLREDFLFVCRQLGIEPQFPHKNKTEHAPYWEYYTDETRELVRQRFEQDIAMFNYHFRSDGN